MLLLYFAKYACIPVCVDVYHTRALAIRKDKFLQCTATVAKYTSNSPALSSIITVITQFTVLQQD